MPYNRIATFWWGETVLIKRLNKHALLFGGAMLLTTITAGSLIGGLAADTPPVIANFREPPAMTRTAATATPRSTGTPLQAPKAPERASATPTRTPLVAPTLIILPEAPLPTPTPETPLEAVAPAPPPDPAAATYVEYTVQRGDILKNVAQRFNTNAAAILALNPQINPDSLTVGEVLRIPGTPQ